MTGVYYKMHMIEVRQTAVFRKWVAELRDIRARAQITRRIERAQEGNLGDVKPVGDGVSEMRIDVGPGYRVYFVKRGAVVILLLCGGDKGSQQRDIKRAKELAAEVE